MTQINSGTALGTGASAANTITVQTGAQLQLSAPSGGAFTVANKLLLNGVGLANTGPTSGALLNVANDNGWSGPIVLDSDSTIGAAEQTFNIVGASETGTTVTIITSGPHNLAVGQQVTIAGILPAGYDGTFTITGITANTFMYTAASGLGVPTGINPTASASATLTISGQISDQGSGHSLTKEGGGILDLSAANTYRGDPSSGGTTINNGILRIQNAQALGTGPGFKADDSSPDAVTVNTNSSTGEVGTLQINGPTGATGLTIANKLLILNGAGFNGDGALDNLQGFNVWTGNVILGTSSASPNVTIEADGSDPAYSLTISGVVSDPNGGNHALTKTGPGILIFTNSNTYAASTTVAAGTLQIDDSQALGPQSKTNPTTVDNGATLALAVDDIPDSLTGTRNTLNVYDPLFIAGNGANSLGALFSESGTNIYYGNITLEPGGASIAVAPDPNPTPTANYFTNDYSLTLEPPGGGPGTLFGGFAAPLTKKGTGQLILPTANDKFTGAVTIAEGWITIQNSDSLGAKVAGVAQNDQPLVTIKDKAALDLYAPAGQTLDLHQNFSITGLGVTAPSVALSEIKQQGAIENISGINSIEGNISYAGASASASRASLAPANSRYSASSRKRRPATRSPSPPTPRARPPKTTTSSTPAQRPARSRSITTCITSPTPSTSTTASRGRGVSTSSPPGRCSTPARWSCPTRRGARSARPRSRLCSTRAAALRARSGRTPLPSCRRWWSTPAASPSSARACSTSRPTATIPPRSTSSRASCSSRTTPR